jgi:hypothetical protein
MNDDMMHIRISIMKIWDVTVGIVLGELFDGLEYHDVPMHACHDGVVLDVKKDLSRCILRLAQILAIRLWRRWTCVAWCRSCPPNHAWCRRCGW